MQVRPEVQGDGFVDDETGQVPQVVELPQVGVPSDVAESEQENETCDETPEETTSPYAALPPFELGDTQIILSFSRRTGGMAITTRPEAGADPLLLLHMLSQAITSVVEHQAQMRQAQMQAMMQQQLADKGVLVQQGEDGVVHIHTDINMGETRKELAAEERKARLDMQRAANPGKQTEVHTGDGNTFTINDRRKAGV